MVNRVGVESTVNLHMRTILHKRVNDFFFFIRGRTGEERIFDNWTRIPIFSKQTSLSAYLWGFQDKLNVTEVQLQSYQRKWEIPYDFQRERNRKKLWFFEAISLSNLYLSY